MAEEKKAEEKPKEVPTSSKKESESRPESVGKKPKEETEPKPEERPTEKPEKKEEKKPKPTGKYKELIKQIEELSVLELAELVKELEERFGVSAAAPVAATVPAAGEEAGPAEEEKTEFTVVLKAAGEQKINAIKAVREVTDLGLKDAKDLVDGAPKEVKANIKKEEAEEIKKKLEAVGAQVELK